MSNEIKLGKQMDTASASYQPSEDAKKLAADFMYFCSLPNVSETDQAIALLKLLLVTRGGHYVER